MNAKREQCLFRTRSASSFKMVLGAVAHWKSRFVLAPLGAETQAPHGANTNLMQLHREPL